jgi:deoxyribodipyrimidine photo-lyase
LVEQTGASRIIYDMRFEPAGIHQQQRVEQEMQRLGVSVQGVLTNLLFHPGAIKSGKGEPYKVFTPFSRACLAHYPPGREIPVPTGMPLLPTWPTGVSLDSLGLLPRIDWTGGLRDSWQPGEPTGSRMLNQFVQQKVHQYADERNRPDLCGTSRLSPYLHFGEISPQQVWRGVAGLVQNGDPGAVTFLQELLWREFAYHLLYHFPAMVSEPLRAEFKAFPWNDDPAGFKAWQRGRTGFPIVDAGMRQLWQTGWMHNRVRMITGSFLVKDLLITWQEGARWFWDTLVDADLAVNSMNWQWVSGCGADAAPFFRIFNPVLQGETYDPQGAYVRQWVGELQHYRGMAIHTPWKAGIMAGMSGSPTGYPEPVVDHAQARKAALDALSVIRKGRS